MIIQKIIDELNEIPEEKLIQIYELIHYFRLGLNQEKAIDPDDTPTPQVIEGIQQGMKEALAGETIPLAQMWDGIDEDTGAEVASAHGEEMSVSINEKHCRS